MADEPVVPTIQADPPAVAITIDAPAAAAAAQGKSSLGTTDQVPVATGAGRPKGSKNKKGKVGPEKKPQVGPTSEKPKATSPAIEEGRSPADIERCRVAGRRAAKGMADLASWGGPEWAFRIFKHSDDSILAHEPKESELAMVDLFIERDWRWFPGWLALIFFVIGYIGRRVQEIKKWLNSRRDKKNAKANPKPAPPAPVPGPEAGRDQHPGSGSDTKREVVPSQIPDGNGSKTGGDGQTSI